MRQLVITDRKGSRVARVEQAAILGRVNRQPAALAQHAVGLDAAIDRIDAVLRQHDQLHAGLLRLIQNRRQRFVQLLGGRLGFRTVRTKALQVVVEVGHVDQSQPRLLGTQNIGGGVEDPLRAGDPRARSPELEQREVAMRAAQAFAQLRRMRVHIRTFAAVGVIGRARGQ